MTDIDRNLGTPLPAIKPYHNEDQRNVHIWASQYVSEKAIRLMAGFYNHNDQITYATLYQWLDMILFMPEGKRRDSANNHQNRSRITFKWLLVRANGPNGLWGEDVDPRNVTERFSHINITSGSQLSRIQHAVIDRDSSDPCRAGHYMLFYAIVDKEQRLSRSRSKPLKILAVCPDLRAAGTTIFMAVKSESGTRDEKTRVNVRKRDKQCRITDQGPIRRERGEDYTALEVAHIFPYAYAGVACDYLIKNRFEEVAELVKTRAQADKPFNAFLLRIDIHRLFDTHQWGIYENKLYVFEKGVSKSLSDEHIGKLIEFPKSDDVEGVNLKLFEHHFFTALMIHVAGVGKKVPKK